MFYRIQFINLPAKFENKDDNKYCIHGIMGFCHEKVADSWINDLSGPNKRIPPNARFYFTENGWDKIGRKVIKACNEVGQRYRIISVKENSVDIVFRDKVNDYEVAVQPKRKK